MSGMDLPPLAVEALRMVVALLSTAEEMLEAGQVPPAAVGLLLPGGEPLFCPVVTAAEAAAACALARRRGALLAVTVAPVRRAADGADGEERALLVAICSPAMVTVRGRAFAWGEGGGFRGWGKQIEAEGVWVAVDPWREERSRPEGAAHA